MKRQKLTRRLKVELERLAALPDDQIDLSDIPECGERWFKAARLREPRR